jgi:hypothetical protein
MKNFDALKQHGDVIWNIANLLRGPHRTALITATTTGKIDVRHVAIPAQAGQSQQAILPASLMEP